MDYEFLEHTADVKFRAYGNTMEEMFVNASLALNETVRGNIPVMEIEEKEIEVEGKDLETLLHNFLEEFLYLLDAWGFLTAKVKDLKFDKESMKLNGVLIGDKVENYKFTNDVKAITFNDIYVREEKDKFVCQVVLDV
jgi:SHS2 domain-containing protein